MHQVARNGPEPAATGPPALGVGDQAAHHAGGPCRFVTSVMEERGIHSRPQQGMGVGGPAHHHPIHVGQLALAGGRILEAAIELDQQLGAFRLKPMHQVPAQRRDGAVLFRIQAFQPGLSGMHREAASAAGGHRVHEVEEMVIGIELVDADAVLHRHRQGGGRRHGLHAAGHPLRFGHQASAETALLHLLARTANVEVDLVVAPVGPQPGRLRQQSGVISAQLQGQGMLLGIEAQQPFQPCLGLRCPG